MGPTVLPSVGPEIGDRTSASVGIYVFVYKGHLESYLSGIWLKF